MGKLKIKGIRLEKEDSQNGTILTRWMRSLVTNQLLNHVVVNFMDEVAGDTTGDTGERENSSDQQVDDIQPSSAEPSKETPSSSHSGPPNGTSAKETQEVKRE